ncbi:MAG: acylneuraminate cytidylyltransferase family protein [Zoogloea sp.]|uniref:acylneuraminate cytidylyltransferase family protein n=1 Tax=Zoogloea sp. TaxID=49181 RepID=UPI0026084116|nr:acylneuraminate cytidylyltransferase family protein [Zoogloea sp.]MDD2991793.1 acylneuraminate cytidylyltransferase family protein [Zoogloea sp.]
MKVLAIIPARGGSKGLPRKNILPLGGRPLIAWSIEAALGASCIHRVVLSSDDDEIIEVAKAHGCEAPFKRPDTLATDEASSMDVVLHALSQLPDHDVVVLLQPTSPLRTSADIDSAFELMMRSGAPSCVSVCPASESPFWMYSLSAQQQMHRLIKPEVDATRRQELPTAYSLNGALYIARTDWLLQHRSFIGEDSVAYVMPRSRSIDIDIEDDFVTVQKLIEK